MDVWAYILFFVLLYFVSVLDWTKIKKNRRYINMTLTSSFPLVGK